MKRNLWRILLVLAAVAPIIAIAWATAAPYDGRQEMAAREAAAKGKTPTPGSEAALWRDIGEIQAGRRMPGAQQELARLGPLQSVGYLGGATGGLWPGRRVHFDQFRVTFRSGTRLFVVSQGSDGKLAVMGFGSPDPPKPQQIMDGYASFSAGERARRTVVQLGVLLAAALFGRLALRIRL